MKNKYRGFGSYLRSKRQQAGLTQFEVSSHFGINAQAISNIERGCAPVPLSRIQEIIDLYKVDQNEFVERFVKEQEVIVRKFLRPLEEKAQA